MSGYEVGQRVWVYTAYRNPHGPAEAHVTKVGRSLVTVSDGRQYRMDTGVWNDRQYGSHYRIKTDAQRAEDERHADIARRLKQAGVEFSFSARLPTEVLEDIAAVLDKHGIGGAE